MNPFSAGDGNSLANTTTPSDLATDTSINYTQEIQRLGALEFNPVEFVVNTLKEQGHPNPTDWLSYLQYSNDAHNPALPVGQRIFLINRAWRTISAQLPAKESARARDNLCEGDNYRVWSKVFAEEIVPLAVKYQLPRPFSIDEVVSTVAPVVSDQNNV